jgi:hypothetical protein
MTPLVNWLIRDHEGIAELLARADSGGELDVPAFELARARLLRHIAIEEKILFPAAANPASWS